MHLPPGLARPVVVALALTILGAGSRASGQNVASTPPPQGDAYRPLGPDLFPLYQHYLRTADSTEVRNLFYLYAATDNPNGSWSRLLAPFFFREHSVEPPVDLFFLFPLLFFHKDSTDESFNYAVPFFLDRRTPDSSTQFVLPAWLRTSSENITRHHVLFPLFRHTTDENDPSQPVVSTRAGIWKILELWESRTDPGSTDYRALTFLNWKDETRSGLTALFSYSWVREGEGWEGRTYLFPLYWHGEYANTSYRWVIPFYGHSEGGGDADFFAVPLLSRIGGSADGERRLDVLYPLFHYVEGPKAFSIASFPLFGYSRSEAQSSWNVLYWPYRTTYTVASGKRTHMVFFPLSYFDVEPDDSKGTRWFFPYIETFDDKRLWRFGVPLYYEYQTLAGGNTDWFFQTGIPLYWSWGYSNDYFAMGFPLYWASRDGPRGWRVLVPLFLRWYSASAEGTHVFPLVSYNSLPSHKSLYILGPTYIHDRYYGMDKELSGTGHHILWPLLGYESRKDGYLYRFLPLFAASREGDTSDLLLSPFYYQQDGPLGTKRYLMPFYGRYETPNLTRDFYAAGSYIQTRETDESGAPVRARDDYLWSLISTEKDLRSGGSHEHALPLLYWNTRTAAEDHTMAGPFYYSHRITDGDEEHYLSLFLGNVFFSKIIETRAPDIAAPPLPPPAADAPALAAASAPAAARTPERVEVWRDQGVLWPFVRWFQGGEQHRGAWVLPFYFDLHQDLSTYNALFPLYYTQTDETPYNLSFFRYFFLFNKEDWSGGYRRTFGQLLFDWKADENIETYRLRLLYPLIEYSWNREGYGLQITPLSGFSRKEGTTSNFIFPFFWEGGTARKTASGEMRYENSHFFLFPLFGVHSKSRRSDYYALFPFLHLLSSDEALHFELWPLLFYRDEPSIHALRLWPLHAEEHGLTAGEFWVSQWFFLSKHFETSDSSTYRLDPFLFRTSSTPDGFGIGGLFELFAYDREGSESSFRMIPIVFGYSNADQAAIGAIPFYYGKNFGKKEIDYYVPWRFLFLTHHLEGASGERHTGVLWKLFEHTDNPNRPEFSETGLLYRFFFSRHTETSSQLQINPLFSYFSDQTMEETRYSFLFSLYSYHEVKGRATHTIFYFLNF